MFDMGWFELMLIAAVAIVVIGPRDLPVVMRWLGRTWASAKRTIFEFQESVERAAFAEDVTRAREDLKKLTHVAVPPPPDEGPQTNSAPSADPKSEGKAPKKSKGKDVPDGDEPTFL